MGGREIEGEKSQKSYSLRPVFSTDYLNFKIGMMGFWYWTGLVVGACMLGPYFQMDSGLGPSRRRPRLVLD